MSNIYEGSWLESSIGCECRSGGGEKKTLLVLFEGLTLKQYIPIGMQAVEFPVYIIDSLLGLCEFRD